MSQIFKMEIRKVKLKFKDQFMIFYCVLLFPKYLLLRNTIKYKFSIDFFKKRNVRQCHTFFPQISRDQLEFLIQGVSKSSLLQNTILRFRLLNFELALQIHANSSCKYLKIVNSKSFKNA